MKCLKNQKTGNIIRVTDEHANQMSGNTWKYITKSEWKVATRIPATETQAVQVEKKEKTLSKKAQRRAKFSNNETKN
jgi:hypothetical protein